MLEHLTLTHCDAVQIYPPPGPPPQNLTIHLIVGGSLGEGAVNVHSGTADGHQAGSVGTGETDDVVVLAATGVWLHYQKVGNGPNTVEVDYEIRLN